MAGKGMRISKRGVGKSSTKGYAAIYQPETMFI